MTRPPSRGDRKNARGTRNDKSAKNSKAKRKPTSSSIENSRYERQNHSNVRQHRSNTYSSYYGTTVSRRPANMDAERRQRSIQNNSHDYPSSTRQSSTRQSSTRQSSTRQSSTRNSRKDKVKKSASRNTGAIAKRLAVFVFVVILGYLSICFYKVTTKPEIKYDVVQYGSIDALKSAEGIIVRNEAVYKSPVSGVVNYNVYDKEKVKKNSLICSVKTEEVVNSLEASLEETNKSIIELQQAREDISMFSEDAKRINLQIKTITDDEIVNFVNYDIGKVYALKENINIKMDTRNQMLLSEGKGSLQDLAEKRLRQEEEINKNTTLVYIEEGGILSYQVDGLEDVLTVDSILNLTHEQTTMIPKDMVETKNVVSQDDAIFKILIDNSWYIATYIDNDEIPNWKEGDTVKIHIGNNSSYEQTEAYIYNLQENKKDTYIVFKIDKNIIDYSDDRNIKIQLNKPQVGIKINKNAVAEKNLLKIPVKYVTENSVIKKTGDSLNTIQIINSGEDKENEMMLTPIVFDVLNAGDVILNPADTNDTYVLSEIETYKGVYVINTGIAEFKKVNTENADENLTHIVLDPILNPGIKIYDRILTDVKNIKEDSKIY